MKPFQIIIAALAVLLAAPAAPAENQVSEIVVIFKTHYDIGYTDLVTNILTRYRTVFADRALAVIDQSQSLPPEQRFTWTVPGLWFDIGAKETLEEANRIFARF